MSSAQLRLSGLVLGLGLLAKPADALGGGPLRRRLLELRPVRAASASACAWAVAAVVCAAAVAVRAAAWCSNSAMSASSVRAAIRSSLAACWR
ncbi:hypothetical protein AB0K64_29625 [Streptomyces sp. NPDC053741]|uniref:hypothetical protein n=1 Tax=Streptomyces TaxID=1883 RepID=UPI002F9161A6